MKLDKIILYHAASLSFGIFAVFSIFYNEKVHDSINNVYEKETPESINEFTKQIKFSNVTQIIGLENFDHGSLFESQFGSGTKLVFNKDIIPSKRNNSLASLIRQNLFEQKIQIGRGEEVFTKFDLPDKPIIFPSLSVLDINNDGFSDVFFPQIIGHKNKLYLNYNGQSFIEVANEYGLGDINQEKSTAFVYFLDFNQDGYLDALAARWGCHDLFFGQGPAKPFVKMEGYLDNYCSLPRGANFLDFNQDGILDIVFANYISAEDIRDLSWKFDGIYNGNKFGGGANAVLQGLPGGKFKLRTDINFNHWRSFTHTAGIYDFNNDGWDDIFFTNDYSTDEVWINQKGAGFVDQTENYFPMYKHGFSGMNSEVFDFDRDGEFEIYISNSFKPPFKTTPNNFWKKSKNKNEFEQMSDELSIGKCGFAWGAKFADVDNNGEAELMVVNGRTAQNPQDNNYDSYWYYNYELRRMPRFLRNYRERRVINYTRYSSNERNCLFSKIDGKYYDIANNVGITDLLDGRGLALTDFENDGLIDYIISNYQGPSVSYGNRSESKGKWIGFQFRDNKNIYKALGSTFVLETESGKRFYILYNPFHGYQAQSDSRLHFGLGDEIPKKLQWISKNKVLKEFIEIKGNTYNVIGD